VTGDRVPFVRQEAQRPYFGANDYLPHRSARANASVTPRSAKRFDTPCSRQSDRLTCRALSRDGPRGDSRHRLARGSWAQNPDLDVCRLYSHDWRD
jgi:hypothetical protein